MRICLRFSLLTTRACKLITAQRLTAVSSLQRRCLTTGSSRTSWGSAWKTGALLTAGGVAVSLAWAKSQNGSQYADTGTPPQYTPSRSLKRETDQTGLKLTLFQYQTCPFCCKVRALLDFYGFSYDVIEVNSVWRTQIKWSSYKKVPILVVEGKEGTLQMNDSSVIMSLLESFLENKSESLRKLLSYYPPLEGPNAKGKNVVEYPNRYFIMFGETKPSRSAEVLKEERKWRKWADDVLVHTLSPNVYRTPSEALQAFRYFSDVGEWEKNFSTTERLVVIYVGAAAMYILGKVLKRRYQLKDDVRESLYDACDEFVKGLGNKRNFVGGDVPNLGDIAVYGVLTSIEGCDAFQDLWKNTKIKNWYMNMKSAVNQHQGSRKLVTG
uniref:Prostaglandin E synthase n=1 Tax=Perinereis aibuhitensis TaxID=126650 RepID=A0A8A6NII4_PERAI|nr:prostaglandin E synthase [Perinereis aibuhitensis]